MGHDVPFDYIVAGGGVAGLTLASRLSQLLPNKSVLLIEAGGDPTVNENVMVPAGYRSLQPSEQAYSIPIESNPNLDRRSSTAFVGKALSGSAAINAGAWTRGPATDYDLWAQMLGDPTWSYDAMLPYFKLTENDQNSTAKVDQHGKNGTITATSIRSYYPERANPLRGRIQQAFADRGFQYNADMNNGQPNGLSEHIEVWLKGRRQLPHQLLDLSRVVVRDNCRVKRVVLLAADQPKATGVELMDGTVLTARSEVILSTGTYHTPQLLMLSGIGNASHLQSHGIETKRHNPSVGANLSDHLGLSMTLRLHPSIAEQGVALMHPSFLARPGVLLGSPLDFLHFSALASEEQQQALKRLNRRASDVALVCRSNATHCESFVSYTPFPFNVTGIPDAQIDEAARGELITVSALALTTTSRGRVSLHSADPTDPPRVETNYFSTESDAYILRESIRQAMSVWTETPTGKATVAKEVVPDGFEPILPGTSDEAINARICRFAYTFEHPMSTCRMAKQPGWEDEEDGGVVDGQCRVFGVQGLRVVDASVFPIPLAAHIQAAVYAVAEKMAVVIAEAAGTAEGV